MEGWGVEVRSYRQGEQCMGAWQRLALLQPAQLPHAEEDGCGCATTSVHATTSVQERTITRTRDASGREMANDVLRGIADHEAEHFDHE